MSGNMYQFSADSLKSDAKGSSDPFVTMSDGYTTVETTYDGKTSEERASRPFNEHDSPGGLFLRGFSIAWLCFVGFTSTECYGDKIVEDINTAVGASYGDGKFLQEDDEEEGVDVDQRIRNALQEQAETYDTQRNEQLRLTYGLVINDEQLDGVFGPNANVVKGRLDSYAGDMEKIYNYVPGFGLCINVENNDFRDKTFEIMARNNIDTNILDGLADAGYLDSTFEILAHGN